MSARFLHSIPRFDVSLNRCDAPVEVAIKRIVSGLPHTHAQSVGPRRAGHDEGACDAPLFRNMKDAENWKIVFEVYAGHPIAALTLAQQLTEISQFLEQRRKGEAIEGLNLAIDALYSHTDFHKVGRKLYRRRLEDTQTETGTETPQTWSQTLAPDTTGHTPGARGATKLRGQMSSALLLLSVHLAVILIVHFPSAGISICCV